MKKRLLYLSCLAFIITLTSCKSNDDVNLTESSISEVTETNLKYNIEKTSLSKGFQSINPGVETIESEKGKLLLLNLGIVNCSMANIDRISRVNNEINIYTSIEKQWGKSDIVIPQILVEIEDLDNIELDPLKINIIPTNYSPISVKYDKAGALNIVNTQFNYTNNTMPIVTLSEEKENYVWNIILKDTFLKTESSSPLYRFYAKVDAQSGEVLESKSTLISYILGKGNILDLSSDKLMAYVQTENKDNINIETIWIYDIENNEKQKIYSTHNSIYSAKFSPDLNRLAIIEHDGKLSNLYIISLDSNLIQKITPPNYNHIWNIQWKDNDLLYGINNDEEKKSSVIAFNITENIHKFLFSVNLNVTNFELFEELFLFAERDFEKDISSFYIRNENMGIDNFANGFKCNFIDRNRLLFSKKIEGQDQYELFMYDIEKNRMERLVDFDVRNFLIINDKEILLINKDELSTYYSVYIYNIEEKTDSLLGQILEPDIFYSKDLNTAFLNILPPIENADSSYIYGINFDFLNEIEKDSF